MFYLSLYSWNLALSLANGRDLINVYGTIYAFKQISLFKTQGRFIIMLMVLLFFGPF